MEILKSILNIKNSLRIVYLPLGKSMSQWPFKNISCLILCGVMILQQVRLHTKCSFKQTDFAMIQEEIWKGIIYNGIKCWQEIKIHFVFNEILSTQTITVTATKTRSKASNSSKLNIPMKMLCSYDEFYCIKSKYLLKFILLICCKPVFIINRQDNQDIRQYQDTS